MQVDGKTIGRGKMYVLVNKELYMSTGKTAAQVAHAVSRLDVGIPRTQIILQATTEQIHNLDTYLERANIPHHMYIDEGVNEVDPMSATALAFGMVADDFTPPFIEDFELYREEHTCGWQLLLALLPLVLFGGGLWLMLTLL